MSCAHSDGWFGVECEWKDGDSLHPPRSMFEWRIVGRCRIYAPNFGTGIECAEGLVVEALNRAGLPDGSIVEERQRFGLYWAKPSRTFVIVPLRASP